VAVAVAVGAAAGRVLGPATSVSGLFLVCPLLWAGLWSVSRPVLRDCRIRLLAVVTVAFASGVAASQYSRGGTAEWGGRYFALALPVAVPLALVCLDALVQRADLSRRAAAGALAAVALPLGLLAVLSLRSAHQVTDEFVDAVAAAGRAAPAGDGGPPVVVTTAGLLPRLAWPTFGEQRWMLVPPAGGDAWLARLSDSGVQRVTLVTPRSRPLASLPDGATVSQLPSPMASWRLERVELG
jgi:hypothetical protein